MNDSFDPIADAALLSSPREVQPVRDDHAAEDLGLADHGHIDPLWTAEALRRREDIRSGRVKTIPSDVALARVRSSVAR